KEVFLVEELIQLTDGPWRKYINNNSSCPHYFGGHENCQCAEFLAFCQHIPYWRTGCQAFTFDFQGDLSASLSATHSHLLFSDLGHKLFSKGNIQDTHHEFEKEHQCNEFCTFFKVPTYDQS
ncbi:hypothetical protein V8E53_014147, partial [Lactarius tabidus]